MAAEAAGRHELPHPGGVTRIRVGAGALDEELPALAEDLRGRALFAITAPPVRRLHGGALERLGALAARFEVLEVADGEAAKSLGAAEGLWRRMAAAGGRRDSRVVAFGGGSVGDLAGFVAGAFLRGVGYHQLPTTLLAQADAAIGGKTAVNLPEAKNSVGLFHHPRSVVCDTAWLRTLPAAELRSGLVEALKMAVLYDPVLLERIEAGLERLLAGDPEALTPVVDGAVAAKVRVVAADPDERGERAALNLGHTLGHAIEAASGYGPIRHGEAVAYGLLFALRLARRRGFPGAEARRLRTLLGRFGLPPLGALDPAALQALAARDKKARESGLEWVVPRALGGGAERLPVEAGEIDSELAEFLARPFG